MSIFGNKNKEGNFTINFMSVKDTILQRGLNMSIGISATLLDDKIMFKERLGKQEPVYLMYDKITRASLISDKEISEKTKAIGEAVVGGILLGSLGALIGAVDGASKNKTITKYYYVFNYINSNNEEVSLPVEVVGATLNIGTFDKLLKDKCHNIKEEKRPETYL